MNKQEEWSIMRKQVIQQYKDKVVLVTGHTGFKGTWLCSILSMAGAKVVGYSLEPPTKPSLFALSGMADEITSIIGDVRDFNRLQETFDQYQPEIVLHLAAQPLVRESYRNPRDTYEINVMGTVNVCECVRTHHCVRSFLNVTTDKVYENKEWAWGYRENEPLDGFDPYSNSKSCSELVTHSYIHSFFGENAEDSGVAVSTARAGNVIGGGDFAADRIIPDCLRAVESGRPLEIRNPDSTRPYQHVLEPLFAYLMIAAFQAQDPKRFAGFYNVGPDECDCVSTGELTKLFSRYWGKGFSSEVHRDPDAPHEANYLKLDCSKLKSVFGWHPVWHIEDAVEKTVEWSKVYLETVTDGNDNSYNSHISDCMRQQIQAYLDS